MNNDKNKTVVLCIMDGWGINQSSDFNAVALAKTPNVDYFSKIYPYSTLDASGEHVGLPKGQVGNSEVGHMNLGSGRVILQTLPKINKAFANNEINNNENFQKFLMKHNKNKKVLAFSGIAFPGSIKFTNISPMLTATAVVEM